MSNSQPVLNERRAGLQMATASSTAVLLLIGASGVSAQTTPPPTSALFDLLGGPSVESLAGPLANRFAQDFFFLVPDLPDDERAFFVESLTEAFAREALEEEVAKAIAAAVTPDAVEALNEMRQAGPLADLAAAAQASPAGATPVDASQLGDTERARLQLMATLVAAQGRAELDLILDEEVARAVHVMVNALGGELGAFRPSSDADFDAKYRQRTLTLAVEWLHRYEAVSDETVMAAISAYEDAAWRSVSDARIEGLAQAVAGAGERVLDLTAPVDEAEPEVDELMPGMPCRANVCGYIVEWNGPIPTAPNRRFGASYEIDRRVLMHLAGAGYRLKEGEMDGGLTIRLAPRMTRGNCAATSGTNDTGCAAIDQVRIDFLGTPPGRENMDPITVRNRCGANSIMGIEGISAYVAIHLDLALTTFEGDERKPPNC